MLGYELRELFRGFCFVLFLKFRLCHAACRASPGGASGENPPMKMQER